MGKDGRIHSSYVVIVGNGDDIPEFYDFCTMPNAKSFVRGRTLNRWEQVGDYQFQKGKKYIRIEPRVGTGSKATFIRIEEKDGSSETHSYVCPQNAQCFINGFVKGRGDAGIGCAFDSPENTYTFTDGQKITVIDKEIK